MIRANADYCLADGRMEVRSIKEIQAGEEVILSFLYDANFGRRMVNGDFVMNRR